jgi:hypothetical protein
MRPTSAREVRAIEAGLVGVIAGYSWWAAGLLPFSAPIDTAVAIPAGIAVALAWGRNSMRSRPDKPALTWRSAAPWLGLIGLLVVLETVNYFSSPRPDHPTLSSMADSLMGSHPGRAAVFAAWLALGWLFFSPRSNK